MTTRSRAALAWAAAASLSGCSVLGMTRLPDDYDPRTIPRCDDNELDAVGDLLTTIAFAGLGTAIAIAGHDAADGQSKWVGVGLSGGVAVLFGLSARAGFGFASKCYRAKKQWDRRQIEQDQHLHEGAEVDREAEQRARSTRPKAPPLPRGFFCASSPTVEAASLCAREKADCETAWGAATAVVSDLTPCALVETAQCYQVNSVYWCSPTRAACEAQRANVAGASTCSLEK